MHLRQRESTGTRRNFRVANNPPATAGDAARGRFTTSWFLSRGQFEPVLMPIAMNRLPSSSGVRARAVKNLQAAVHSPHTERFLPVPTTRLQAHRPQPLVD